MVSGFVVNIESGIDGCSKDYGPDEFDVENLCCPSHILSTVNINTIYTIQSINSQYNWPNRRLNSCLFSPVFCFHDGHFFQKKAKIQDYV